MKAARVLTAALRILEVADALLTAARMLAMAESGLSGQGFIFTKEIAEAGRLEREASSLKDDYLPFSDSLSGRWYQLTATAGDPVAAGTVSGDLSLRTVTSRMTDDVAYLGA